LATYTVDVLKVAAATVPNYEVFWMAAPGPPEPIVFTVGVVRGGGRTLLINSGLPLDYRPLSDFWEAWFPPHRVVDYVPTEQALASLDVRPEAVTHVLVTPLTAYTTGRLDLFPNAELVLGRRGWLDLWAPAPDQHALPRHVVLPDPILDYVVRLPPERLRLLDDEAGEVLPGLRAWFAGGHHRSSMAYLIATERGTVGWCDAAFKFANVEQHTPLGIAESVLEALRAYGRLRREAQLMVPPYDPELFVRYPRGRVA
jgi:glyoxylase-like metal-dependent hydrolase (beta-lactamase superfamily II)